MTLHIVVPVKRLSEAKRRLSPVLGAEDRLALTWSLLRHALAVVQEAQQTLGAQGAVVEVFASESSGSWTITVTFPNGATCLVASGQAYEELAEALPPTGDGT